MNLILHFIAANWLALSLLIAVLTVLARDIAVEHKTKRLEEQVRRLRGGLDAVVEHAGELRHDREALARTILAAAEAEDSERVTQVRRASLPPPRQPLSSGSICWGEQGRRSVPRLPSFDVDATRSWSGPGPEAA